MPYRDELQALELRRAALEAELAEVRARIKQRRLPVLTAPRVESPCDVPWAEMAGDEKVRLCGQCAKYVYNLTAMTRAEAEDLLAREPRLCVRYYERSDGTVLTADCMIGARRRRVRRFKRAAPYALLAAGVATIALVAGTAHTAQPIPARTVDEVVARKPGGRVRAEGTLVHGSIETARGQTRFVLSAAGVVMPVRYARPVVPDGFRDIEGLELSVLVEGELGDDGVFRATLLMARGRQGYMLRDEAARPALPRSTLPEP